MSELATAPEVLLEAPQGAQPSVVRARKFQQQMGHVSRQSSIFFAGTIFTAVCGYLFKVYLARVLGAEALGIYALGMTIVGFLGLFNALGLPQSAVRFVAAYSATGKIKQLGGFLARALILLMCLNVLLAAVMLAIGPLLAAKLYHTPDLSRYVWAFAIIMVIGGLNTFLGQALAGFKDVIRRTVITSFIASPLNMILAVLLITLGTGLWGYILAQVLSAAVVLVLLAVSVWKLTPAAARVRLTELPPLQSEVLSFSAVAFGIGFLEFLMAQADKVLIGFYLDARAVGVYAVAMALVAFIPILLQSVNQIFSPVIADLHARGERELLGRMFQTLTKWIIGFTLPLAAAVIIFARPFMGIFGRDFEMGWPILVIGTLGQLVNCGVGSVGYLLLMSGNQRRLVRVQAVCGGLMVLLNLCLIPRWGIIGAAAAAALTAVIGNLCYLREVRSALQLSPYNRSYAWLAPGGLAAVAVCLLVQTLMRGIQPAWLAPAIGLPLAYAAFVAAGMFGLNSDDRLVARAVVARIRGRFETVTSQEWQARIECESGGEIAS